MRPAPRSLRAPHQIPVVLREVPGHVTVSVSESAYDVIKMECLRFADRRGVETGGYLAGNVLRSHSERGVDALRGSP
ncbi:MAG TPA: hypothetical protein VLK79_06290 [Gaiellales bacterium]|nr:hypothetical protein [Gaiellales bacterium]